MPEISLEPTEPSHSCLSGFSAEPVQGCNPAAPAGNKLMNLAIENAALNAIRNYLEPGESALGTAVDIRHIAATPVGQRVTAKAEVTLVEGKRIVFAVTAHDEVEEIGRGTHERMVVDLRRLTRRLEGKSSSL